jgi:5-formyltetrahydrofolate cyclo-ligase
MLLQRRSFEGPGKIKADKRIYQQLTHHQLYQHASTICTYVSTIDEVDTHAFVQELLTKQEKTLVVPKIEGGIINLYIIRSYDDLKKSTYGLLEPKNHAESIAVSAIDLFIVPGVAFGRDGTRIGMGKGYYDRLLSGVRAPCIGLCYGSQLFDSIPTSQNDKKVDIILTESKTYDLTNASLSSV